MHALLRSFRLCAGALAVASLVAACGGGSSPPPDTTAPTVTISSNASGTIKAGGSVTYTFTFSEDVGTSFDASDVTVSGGTAGTLTKASATSYSMVVTPTANTNGGTLAVSVAASRFTDTAGNANTAMASASAVSFDTQAPSVAITSGTSGTATGPVTFTFTFTEDVGTSFDAADVTVTGGTKAASVTKSSATVYTLVVTPTANTSGTMNLAVAAGGFSDAAGNASAAAAQAAQAYNTVVVTPLVFASGYTNKDADGVTFARAGRSVEGGSFNWYQDPQANDWSNFWWNGISPVTEATPNFYFGLGFSSASNVPFVGAYVNAANDGSVTLSGQTKLRIAVWGNDEVTSRKVPTFTVFVQLKQAFAGCYVEAAAPVITPPAIGAQTYTLNLSDFTIKNNCANSGVQTAADVFTKPIGSVHVQILKANMFFSGTAASANGINLGPISFQP